MKTRFALLNALSVFSALIVASAAGCISASDDAVPSAGSSSSTGLTPSTGATGTARAPAAGSSSGAANSAAGLTGQAATASAGNGTKPSNSAVNNPSPSVAATSSSGGGGTTPSPSGKPSSSSGPKATASANSTALPAGTSSTSASPSASSTGGTPSTALNEPVPSTGCGKARSLQDGNRTLSSGGQNRQYHLKTPSNYDNKHPYRLVFTFHWFYGSIDAVVNPPDADHNTDRPFYGIADLSGDSTIFVAPQGLTDSQGAGWQNPDDRDVKFTDDMLTAISNDLCIDTSRVFTMGFSYGGSMSYELACARADKFRAALLYDPGTLSGTKPASDCTKPIAVFQSHGADDQTLSYSQGLGIFNVFTKLNGCTAATPSMPPTNGHTCTSFEGCSNGHPARFCGFGSGENNPHNTSLKGHYPAAKDPGKTSSWVPEEAWAFITQF